MQLKTPIIFCTFNRLDSVQLVFEQIRKASPQKLYLVSDGPRPNRKDDEEKIKAVRKYILDNIDWDCEVHKNFADKNMGCGIRITSGISWTFETEEEAIILEDDCLPQESFFPFCEELLDKYRNNSRVMCIAGNNNINYKDESAESYYFSHIPFIWGWATWKRAWEKYDLRIQSFNQNRKLPIWKQVFPKRAYYFYMSEFKQLANTGDDIWDYQWLYTVLLNNGYAIIPRNNMIQNIGFVEESTHTGEKAAWIYNDMEETTFPLCHPKEEICKRELELRYMDKACKPGYIMAIKSIVGRDVNKSFFEKEKSE